MGVKRTYALSIIRDMAPDVFAEFQEQPIAQQQATREHDLQGIIAQLTVEREQVLARQEDMNTVVTRLEMELAAERGSRQRMQELEEKHRNEVDGFIQERDAAQRGMEHEAAKTRQMTEQLAQVKTEQSRLEQLLAAYRAEQEQGVAAGTGAQDDEPDGGAAHAADAGVVRVTTMAVPCDVRSLTVDVEALVRKMEPLKTMEPASMTRDEQRTLMKAFGRLARSLQELGVLNETEGGA
jgi:chromosome segregation ATPase